MLASLGRKRLLVIGLALALFSTGGFAIYLNQLYGQLETAFTHLDEFMPTRIYSDVSRIYPPLPREEIETRLKSLGYSAQRNELETRFELHQPDYPSYLIPDQHPQHTASNGSRSVTLRFDTAGKDALLQSILLGTTEVPDIYLEPELVTTLTRGGGAKREIRSMVKWKDIPDVIWKAIIAVEDQHYLEHAGFDPRGLARAMWVNLKTLSFAQGGSTITQQLVKNLMARHSKNVFRKVSELFLALILEVRMDKERILERYLNEVYLGQVGSMEVHGVAEGAKYFFGKRVDELRLSEAALMAGLIRGPGFYSPYRYRERAMERQRLILKKMVETGYIAQAEADVAANETIELAPPQTTANKAPYFADFVKAELIRLLKDKISEIEITSAGFRVYTTLDSRMNQAAQRSVSQGIAQLEANLHVMAPDRLEGALAAVDQSTGYVRALIGGRSYAESNFNRILNMRRQVGSTFKPLVYLSAFKKGENSAGVPYGPGYPAEDAPWTLNFDQGKQKWSPRNYDKEYKGWTSLRVALANSVNTVAAKLGVEVGNTEIISTARALGIESELPNVPSLSLGVAELSPVELLKAYATIANHGVQDELTVIRGIALEDGSFFARFVYHPKQVYDPASIDLLTDVLQNVFIDGTARAAQRLGWDRPAAGKTGTTSHHRDSWFVGYTPQLTAVVWVGMDQAPLPAKSINTLGEEIEEKPHVVLSGAGSAMPIWANFMKEALSGEPPVGFYTSPHLVSVQVDRRTGKQASFGCPEEQTVVEKYIVGHEPRDSSCETVWPPTVGETSL